MAKKISLFALSVLTLALALNISQSAQGQNANATRRPANKVLNHALDIATGRVQPRVNEPVVSSGVTYALLLSTGEIDKRIASVSGLAGMAAPLPNLVGKTAGCSNVYTNSTETMRNIRVNQDCSLRRQAEEVIAINPNNPKNLIAGQNDSRIGFNRCGYDFSFNGGKTWGDQLPPFYQFLNQDGVTFDACSDPTATFDAAGNAYVGGVLFEVLYADSAFLVEKSNAGIGGAFFHSPKPGPFQVYLDNPPGVVANDNNPNIFNDKEFIVADSHPVSPHANNVYATWTRFNGATGAGVGGDSPIYFSQSTDGGFTWSPGIEISGANASACTVFSGETNANACDQDQGSHPVVGSDGTIYVAFGNGNTPTPGVNQHLIVSCSASCDSASSWSAPVKISDDFGTQPVGPNSSTACPSGRQCLPPNGYRMDDFVEGSVSVDDGGNLYFVWADFRNGGGSCTGSAATATPPCNNDVFYAFSTDHGATWSAPINVTPASSFGPTAQWMPWSAVTSDGRKLFIAYYDRSYGCEFTGCNDITLATVGHAATQSPSFAYARITTSSMPNLVVANNPAQAGFLGDYMWVAADTQGRAYIVWADTRGLNSTVEEDIYFAQY